jgi:putative hydrolase of the HAD superfamily
VTRITALWTDFGGVLTPPIGNALSQVADLAGVPVPELLAGIRRVAAKDGVGLLDLLQCGRISQREWGRRVTDELGPAWVPRIDLGDFGTYWHANRPFNTVLYDELVAARQRGRERGLKLGMLTNSVLEWEVHRDQMIPDRTVFDRVINSHEVGVCKPDPEIYLLAERALDVPPAGCLLIDDLEANCAVAVERGWQAIHHVDTEDTLAALHALL